MKSTRTYADVTARSVGPRTLEWLNELVERFGDERVSDAIEAEGERGDFNRLLGRIRDRLAQADNRARRLETPKVVYEGPALMSIVRGQVSAIRPFGYETRGLTVEEYAEVLTWASERLEARAQ